MSEEKSEKFTAPVPTDQEISETAMMDEKDKNQTIQGFIKRYGLSSPINYSANKRYCVHTTTPSCLLECLPEGIVQEILSRLSIPDLLMARQSCVAWHRMVSLSPIFQELYDERNHQSWIALTATSPHNRDGFVLFNTNDTDHWYFLSLAQHLPADPMTATTSWLLKGVADGLMLLANTQGRLVVVNPLTRGHRLLPDAQITPRLSLESCLKKKLWRHDQQSSMSMHIVVDSASKTFKVVVVGEVRKKQVHALTYSSLTDTWTIKLCCEVEHNFVRGFVHSTLHGNTIYCTPILHDPDDEIYFVPAFPVRIVSYNIETQLTVVVDVGFMEFQAIGRITSLQMRTIGIVVYKTQIFLLGVVAGTHELLQWRPFSVVGLWEANLGTHEWKLLTTTPVEWVNKYRVDFWSCDVAAAYDGDERVRVIARNGRSRTIFVEVNLGTKEWKMISEGNSTENRTSFTLISRRNKVVQAFHMTLKFCTAI